VYLNWMKIKEPIELYIHIPFCKKKCNYCDFLSYAAPCEEREAYVKALLEQIRIVASGIVPGCDPEDPPEERESKFRVSTVYIGGGTPSLLSDEQISNILCQLKESFDILENAEITIEANPGTLTLGKLENMRKSGINRLSLGLQSVNEEELKVLGRIHNYDDFVESYVNARKAGFDNISVDIMTALPGQTKELLKATIDKVLDLNPEHISAYSLIIEEETPFFDLYGDIEGPVVGEDLERELYYYAKDRLSEAGFKQYEISNFAKPGYESRHNTGYWKRVHYLGLGLGAASFFAGFRVTNTESMSEYLKDPTTFMSVNRLSENDEMEEFMYLGLRMIKGVNTSEFYKAFGREIDDVYGSRIQKLIDDELLSREDNIISLTNKGIDYGNHVFSQFLL